MNMLQKTLLSAAAILTFSSYSYYLRTQDTQLALAVSTADAANTAQQNPVDSTATQVSSDFQAYVNQINAEAKQQTAQPKPQVIRYDDEGGDGEGEDGGRVQVRTRQTPPVQQSVTTNTQTTQPQVAPTPAPTPAPAPVAAQTTGQYKNGSYTGSSVNVYYGYVQVQAIIRGGKIADVKFLQYPSDRTTSQYINSQAMPLLTQEAIQAQSANVNGVSGASATSQGFIESLGSALSQA